VTKKITIYVFVALLTFMLGCKKSLFGKVEVKGRLVDYFTNQPVAASVKLGGDDNNQKNAQPAIILATVKTDNDGTFTIKDKAVKSGQYYLSFQGISQNGSTSAFDAAGKIDKFSIAKNGSKDFGTLYETTHTFYCKITLNYTSNVNNDIYIDYIGGNLIYFPSGVNTQTTTVVKYFKSDYESHNHNFDFTYLLLGPSVNHRYSVSVPILSEDTVYTTINY
jgi:hypothetical protein